MDTTTGKIQTVAVLYAMEEEAAPFVKLTGARKVTGILNPKLPMIHYETTVKELKVHIVCLGKDKDYGVDLIGKLGASMATQETIDKIKPDLLLNAGTSGAFEFPEARINQMFIAVDNVYINDRRTSMKGYEEYITGKVPMMRVAKLQKELGLTGAIVSSSDSMDMVETDIKMARSQKAQLLDMEIGTIAWVARQYDCPLISIKGVSNHVYGVGDKKHLSEFYEYLDDTATVIGNTLLKVVDFIDGKTLKELDE